MSRALSAEMTRLCEHVQSHGFFQKRTSGVCSRGSTHTVMSKQVFRQVGTWPSLRRKEAGDQNQDRISDLLQLPKPAVDNTVGHGQISPLRCGSIAVPRKQAPEHSEAHRRRGFRM